MNSVKLRRCALFLPQQQSPLSKLHLSELMSPIEFRRPTNQPRLADGSSVRWREQPMALLNPRPRHCWPEIVFDIAL
ncbi:hypothetical protein TcasGA2_TC001955 [Tribolium castaneum]|uniref:Uncharacterized protein n=1 Tax=Tribolium castaneum TaxID=7070 RepID=D7EJ27_TRICA|nr:hypothetical protein TcasGA2_TC001955 [Tribolium castaneum]